MRHLTLAAALLALAAPALTQPARPRLVVVLVVDQMRADYAERFGHQWTAGLRRLLDQGAWFTQAAYPYSNTITCAGHTTIATGTLPSRHGLVLNTWWDRDLGRMVNCTDDPAVTNVAHGAPKAAGGDSASRMLVPTLADELRATLSPAARVVALSHKARSAVTLAGRRADLVTWVQGGVWVTSTYYSAGPVPFLQRYVAAHPVSADFDKIWTLSLSPDRYLFEDAAAGERPPRGWSATFPHPITPAAGGAVSTDLWERTPFADEYLGALATAAVDEYQLGRGPGIDYLAVSFSALDRVGHAFGPRSVEAQDVLVRLDATIGRVLAHLDRTVGADRYVLALSADHGVAPVPEQMAALGFDAGRVPSQTISDRVEPVLAAAFGAGKHLSRVTYTDLYFAPGIYDKLRAQPVVLQRVTNAILSVPGIERVLASEVVRDGLGSPDSVIASFARSYYQGRSGDLLLVPRPYWFHTSDATTATTHGTPHLYDSRVPVILFGAGIAAGRHSGAASPVDIAPTLAALCGVTLSRTDGRVLNEALRGSAP